MEKITEKIKLAECSIDVAMYQFTNYKLISSILSANKRGVKVRVIMDKSMLEGDNRTTATKLKAAGKRNTFFAIKNWAPYFFRKIIFLQIFRNFSGNNFLEEKLGSSKIVYKIFFKYIFLFY